MGQYLDYYCGEENRRLKCIVDSILRKFGGIYPCDYDDFYSLAAMVCWKSEEQYNPDKGVPFEAFFRNRLKNKIKTMITARNRDKRTMKIIDEDTGNKIPVPDIRLDAPISKDGEYTIGDITPSMSDLETVIFEEKRVEYSEKMMKYLDRLSNIQREVLRLNVAGYVQSEIIEELHITYKEYIECMAAIHSYRNVSVLF